MKFTRIPIDAFQKLQINAGILTTDFTPSTGEVGADGQIGATTGGVTFTATPTFTDFGEDIDNCPKNMKEFKRQDMVEAKMSGTFINADTKTAKLLCGAADIDASDTTKVVPRMDLKDSDFTDIWLVGDYSDKNGAKNGGFIAIHMMNALSTGGFQLKTADKAKGQFAFEFMAHYSLAEQDKVPYEIYIKAGTEETA